MKLNQKDSCAEHRESQIVETRATNDVFSYAWTVSRQASEESTHGEGRSFVLALTAALDTSAAGGFKMALVRFISYNGAIGLLDTATDEGARQPDHVNFLTLALQRQVKRRVKALSAWYVRRCAPATMPAPS